jgi:polyisoprenoid-binding protein YceI
MTTKSVLIAALVLTWLIASARAADTYNIDPMHTSVGFSIRHMVINKVKGKFNEFSGTVVLEDKTIKEATGTIQTRSVDTGIAQRDDHLRSANFFDVQKFPAITFQTKRVEKKGDQTILVGDYTMHGVTRELALPVELSGPIKDPRGSTRIGIEGKAKLNRRDYGLTYNQMLEAGGLVVGDEVEIEINAEAVKAASK